MHKTETQTFKKDVSEFRGSLYFFDFFDCQIPLNLKTQKQLRTPGTLEFLGFLEILHTAKAMGIHRTLELLDTLIILGIRKYRGCLQFGISQYLDYP